MTDDDDSSSSASMAAQHSVAPRTGFKVAPTDGTTKFNTIRIPLIPVACWRLNDPAFGFDSSFVAPTFRDEIATLSGIVAANPQCPATLFGHCDPAGGDAINKTLGDRRAIAIYALLTRQPDLWEYLYSDPQVGDRWGTHAIQTMLSSLVDNGGTPYYLGAIDGVAGTGTADAIKQFQGDNSDLSASGRADAPTRKKLFEAYMDWLCTSRPSVPPESNPKSQPEPDPQGGAPPESGPQDSPKNASQVAPDSSPSGSPTTPFQMQPTDFLGGAGAKLGDLPKMSLQSCGKLNPIVLLTTAEMQWYDGANRNADDAPNRRVLMFFFAKGTTVNASVWPCPKVKESGDACKAAFWPGGDAKRKNGATLRRYKDTRDTMACRFYDRFARRSPCEAPPPVTNMIMRFLDDAGSVVAAARCKLGPGAVAVHGTPTDSDCVLADGDGKLEIAATSTAPATAAKCDVRWGPADADPQNLPYLRTVFLRVGTGDEGIFRRMHNLGYEIGPTREDDVRLFQTDFGRPVTGKVADIAASVIAWHDQGVTPAGGEVNDG